MAVVLEEMRRGRGLVRLRGSHIVDVAGVQSRLVKQRRVKLVARGASRREERKVAVVQVGRQIGRLRLRVEGQRGVGAGRRRVLAKAIVRVEDVGLGDAAVGL